MIVIQKSQGILTKLFNNILSFLPFVQNPIDILSLMQRFSFTAWVDGLSSGSVEYDNTLAVLSVWSDPCGFGKEW
jgi:hypothetical protein